MENGIPEAKRERKPFPSIMVRVHFPFLGSTLLAGLVCLGILRRAWVTNAGLSLGTRPVLRTWEDGFISEDKDRLVVKGIWVVMGGWRWKIHRTFPLEKSEPAVVDEHALTE